MIQRARRKSEAVAWVEGDAEWVPAGQRHLESAFLVRPLEVGDYAEWRANGSYRNGKVLGAVGNGMGIEAGQFIEASYWAMDKDDNLYAGDTSVGRVTKIVAPRR